MESEQGEQSVSVNYYKLKFLYNLHLFYICFLMYDLIVRW